MSTNTMTNFISSINFQNSASVGAFYICRKPKNRQKDNQKWTKKIYNKINTALKQVPLSLSNFNPVQFSKNLSSVCTTKFAVEHIAQVVALVIASKPVKDKMMLDLFMDSFAPVLNLNLINLGYNSLDALKQGMQNGTISNTSQFIQGMSDAFDKLLGGDNLLKSNSLYEEILQIDVVNAISFEYKDGLFVHRIDIGAVTENILAKYPKIKIHLDASIKNPDGNYLYPETYVQKLAKCMADKLPVTLQVGKNIFKNCAIYYMNPLVDESVYKLRLQMELIYNFYPGTVSI